VGLNQTTIKLLISGLDELEASHSEKAIDWCTDIPALERKGEIMGVDLLSKEIDNEYEAYYNKIADLKYGLWSILHKARQDEAIKNLMEDINE